MKVLFENKLKTATFSSLNENTSFPLVSLVHQFLRYKYKATTFEDTITITLPAAVNVNSFWFGYSNATAMTIRLYSNALVLLRTITVNCTYDNGAEYFAETTGVRVIEIDASCAVSSDLQIGGVAIGMATSIPFPIANFEPIMTQNIKNDETESGQVLSRYIEPLLKYDLSYSAITKSGYENIFDSFYSVGNGHVWCDITDGDHSIFKPLYSVTNLVESPNKSNGKISFKITFLEAR